MEQPAAVLGAAVAAGAAAWPWLRAGPVESLTATVVLALLALAGRGHRAAWLAVAACGFTLGLGAVALRAPAPTTTPGPLRHLQGRVTRVSGRELLVDSTLGPVRLCCADGIHVGDEIAAVTRTWRRPAVLPGGADPRADDLRAGRHPLRAASVLVLGPAAPRADPFATSRHRALLRALALGDRSDVSDATRGLLRRTGTSHLLAISGLHVGLLASAVGGATWLLTRPLALGRHWRLARVIPAVAAAVAATAYAVDVGAPASARRAAVMVIAAVGVVLLGRRPRGGTLLGVAATGLVLTDPGTVGDLGFQLSFSAVIGILLVVPRFTRLLPPDGPAALGWVVRSVATTCGATAGTLPVVAWRFQQLAPLAPLANLLAAPLVGSFVVPAALLAARLPAPLAALPLWLAEHALDLVLGGLHLLDRDPWSPAVGPVGAWLLAAALLARRRAAAAALFSVLALGLRALPAHRLTVTILGVGQGDAALIEWPDGRRWLVDGGPGRTAVAEYLRRRGIRHLDALALSHPHPDHSTGLLGVADALPFDSLWLPRRPRSPDADDWELWLRAAERGAPVHLADDEAPAGVRVEHPLSGWHAVGRDAVNEESLVLAVGLGRCSALLAGDIEEDAERTLARTLPPATLVKVPHHGSRSSSSAGFVRATRPAVAVISVGAGNPYGHPHADALARWLFPPHPAARSGGIDGTSARAPPAPRCGPTDAHAGQGCRTRLMRTDQVGTVEWSTDGERWWLRSWRADRGWRTEVGADTPS